MSSSSSIEARNVAAQGDKHEPPVLESNAHKLFVAIFVVLCQFVQMIPFGATISAATRIAEDLGVTEVEAAWIAASYPLTQGAFVLMGGRVGTVYGHKNTVIASGIWWIIFHIVSGFVREIQAFCAVRALSGIGGGFMVPNLVALLTITFPPGRWRNITVGLFGAMAPVGAAGGTVFAGFFVQLTPWRWLFFFLAILGAVVFTVFILIVPGEPEPLDKGGKIDYVGAYLGVGGLILFNFVWNQAPLVGWDEPYEYALLIVSILHFVGFATWEMRFASEPILPVNIWTAPSFGIVVASIFTAFMAVGIVIWYIILFLIEVRHYTLFENAAAWSTLAVGGAIAAVISGQSVRYLPAQYIMFIGSATTCVSITLIATMPAQQTYWAQVFPALIVLSFGPDFLFTAAQIIASNTVRRDQQGTAGSLIGTIQAYGLSTGLGFAGTVESYTNGDGLDMIRGYRNALYLGIGMAGVAAITALAFVRIPKDRREGWNEEESLSQENKN